jgi:NAD(P)-dependent dehydrogenase (short-subunit alcohol dehydrogenase family)
MEVRMPDDVVLITGASSGVGLSLTHHLSGRFHVLAVARSLERLEAEFGADPDVTIYGLDLSDADAVQRVLSTMIDRHGFIGYVINNAGVIVRSPLEQLDEQDILHSLHVNALAPAAIMRRLLPAMRACGFGRIINVTSGAPLNCFAEFSAYSASKGALNAFAVTAAREHADTNIKINLMSPGPVRSRMAPDGPLDPSVCHPTVDYLLSLDAGGPTGRFFWLGYEVPLFPDLEGIDWLEGRADERFQKVF